MRTPNFRASVATWLAFLGVGSMMAVAAAAWPAADAHADDPPPGIPMTLYGTAAGAVPGQRVIAMVLDGTSIRACSNDPAYDMVLTSGGTVYRVSVNSDQTKTGCGAPGRQVFLYFAPLPGVDGRAATATIPWQGSASQGTVYESNVTVTSPLSNKVFVPVASDAAK